MNPSQQAGRSVGQCPACGVRYQQRPDNAGRRVRCPGCGDVHRLADPATDSSRRTHGVFVVEPNGPAAPIGAFGADRTISPGLRQHDTSVSAQCNLQDDSGRQPQPPTQTVPLTCRGCDHACQLPVEFAGRKVRCPRCGDVSRVSRDPGSSGFTSTHERQPTPRVNGNSKRQTQAEVSAKTTVPEWVLPLILTMAVVITGGMTVVVLSGDDSATLVASSPNVETDDVHDERDSSRRNGAEPGKLDSDSTSTAGPVVNLVSSPSSAEKSSAGPETGLRPLPVVGQSDVAERASATEPADPRLVASISQQAAAELMPENRPVTNRGVGRTGPAESAVMRQARELLQGGQAFPFDFDVRDLDGQSLRLSDLQGKVVIVDFWGTWCPPCRKEIPSFVRLQEEYGDRGLQMIGLNYERGSPSAAVAGIRKFRQSAGINYPCALGNAALKNQVPGFRGYPTTLFIDRTGSVRLKIVGLHAYDLLEAIVLTLLDENAGRTG